MAGVGGGIGRGCRTGDLLIVCVRWDKQGGWVGGALKETVFADENQMQQSITSSIVEPCDNGRLCC